MLKVYRVNSYVSINGEEWEEVGSTGYAVRDDNPTEKVFFENFTFEQCYEYLQEHGLDGIWRDVTLFKKRPILYIGWSLFDSKCYESFETISYKYVYDEWETVPLKWIMEHASADQCIQYLKERGMTTCPILK
jgi:hypothetical protein